MTWSVNVLGGVLHQDVSRGGFNCNVLGGCPTSGCVQRGFKCNVLGGCPTSCVQREFNGNVVSRGGPK